MGQTWATGLKRKPNMNATPSVAKATVSKQIIPGTASPTKDRREPQRGLSPEELKARASTSTKVMTEILDRDKRTYSFRHWGINE